MGGADSRLQKPPPHQVSLLRGPSPHRPTDLALLSSPGPGGRPEQGGRHPEGICTHTRSLESFKMKLSFMCQRLARKEK